MMELRGFCRNGVNPEANFEPRMEPIEPHLWKSLGMMPSEFLFHVVKKVLDCVILCPAGQPNTPIDGTSNRARLSIRCIVSGLSDSGEEIDI